MFKVVVLVALAVCFASAIPVSKTCAKLCLTRALKKQAAPASCYKKCLADVKAADTLMDAAELSDSEAAFTSATLKAVYPLLAAKKADEYFPHLKSAMDAGSINSCRRISAFLAQLGHESGQLRWFEVWLFAKC